MDSGKLVYTIPEAHGPNIEVTALALDKSGYRLISGAFDSRSSKISRRIVIEFGVEDCTFSYKYLKGVGVHLQFFSTGSLLILKVT
jgi:hypothetical protein